MNSINTLTLAMMDGCPHCHSAKIALAKYHVAYSELNWSKDENDKTFAELGIARVPVLLIPDSEGLRKIEGESAIAEWARAQQ